MKNKRPAHLLYLALAMAFGQTSSFGDAVDWPTLGFVPATTNTFSHPTCMTHAGDNSGRLFIQEQAGLIWIVQSNAVLPFLNLTNRVLAAGAEQGLLGLAFPSGYSTNGHFYVNYTRQPDGATVVSRFSITTDPNVADPTSEQLVMLISQPYNNHNGGQLAFGPDGYLYIGMGDGGAEGDPLTNGQSPGSLLGKLLRIDVEGGLPPYAVPVDNPFLGDTNYAPEIWSLGLRNPWRFSFDRLTGDLYIGDVGQNQYEEIDFQPAGSRGGQNYGWSIMEGPVKYHVPPGFTNFGAFTAPLTWYDHVSLPADLQACVVGGYVYRGPPEARLDGLYLFGDFMAGWIWGLKQVGTNWERFALISPAPVTPSHLSMSTFGEDDQGQLYLADYFKGGIYRVQDTHQAWTPVFAATGGIINSNAVVVSCVTPNATIHYTTNGVDPTESDPIIASGSTVPVATGATNKVRAFRSDLAPSGVGVAKFTLQVGLPIFTPPAGPITNNSPVSIGSITPGAVIYYTTNFSTPTTNSLRYGGPLTISGAVNIKAIATASGYSNSAIALARYSAALAGTPMFDPASGPITNGTALSLSCSTLGAVIYYTLDGSPPTTNSTIYSGPFIIDGGTTVSAMAVANGYLNSPIGSVTYTLVQTAPPLFTPAAGPLAYGALVSLSCATPGATIYYSVDGSAPSTNGLVYSAPFPILEDTLVQAFATASEHLDSDLQLRSFTLIQAASPVFEPTQGPLTTGSLITISCATPNATVRYTLDGSAPDTNSAVYSTPIQFTGPAVLKARAYANQLDPSDINSTFYALVDFQPAIVITLAGGSASGFSNGIGTSATFSSPQGICADPSGNLYVADTGNNVIRKITPAGEVSTFAGTGVAGAQLGPAEQAQFAGPTGVCLDKSGNFYVADGGNCNRVCKIDTNGLVTVLANLAPCGNAAGLWQLQVGPDGNIYVGYWATLSSIAPGGTVTDLAGSGCNCPGAGWALNIGPAVDGATNVFSASGVNLWRTAPDGTTDLFAGGNGEYSDGPRLLAGLVNGQDVAIDSQTNLVIADATRVRLIRPDGWVKTLAGTGVPGYVNGAGSVAQFNNAAGLCVDAQGAIYVADSGNNCIRKILRGGGGPVPLSIALSERQVVLRWPIWAAGFVPESTTSLSGNTVWTPLTNGVTASVNEFVLTNSLGTSALFYRLHHP